MHKDSYEDEAPDQFTRDYGIGGNEDFDSDAYSCSMPGWAKMILAAVFLGGGALLYELLNGNRAVMIFLGCAIPIIGFALWSSWRDEHEHTD